MENKFDEIHKVKKIRSIMLMGVGCECIPDNIGTIAQEEFNALYESHRESFDSMQREKLVIPKIKICKFAPLRENFTPGAIIEITDDLPPYRSWDNIKGAENFYEIQAQCLADALFSSLPQGTLDRLVIKLMQRKISCYSGKTES